MDFDPSLTSEHRAALAWFLEHAGQVVPWAELNRPERRLAIIPKGIYRPKGWRHSLSIKIIPGGVYPDEEPKLSDGSVSFRYHQETPEGLDPTSYFTNAGLGACLVDGTPVGVIRRVNPKPKPRYEVLGLGRVIDWKDGFFTIEMLEPERADPPQAFNSIPNQSDVAPAVSIEDARTKIAQAIVRRRGQAKFRAALLQTYGGRCVISDCDVVDVLEAAHIKPYLGDHTNIVQNGLLLRADLHTLFDLGLLSIEPGSRTVRLDVSLQGSEYWVFQGRAMRPPALASDTPAQDCLDYAWSEHGRKASAVI
jgi:hypothetical protein